MILPTNPDRKAVRMHPFRKAIEALDIDGVLELFSPDVRVQQSRRVPPVPGREALGLILRHRPSGASSRTFGTNARSAPEGPLTAPWCSQRGWEIATPFASTSSTPAQMGLID